MTKWMIHETDGDELSNPICNFRPVVSSIVDVLTVPYAEPTPHVTMILTFPTGEPSNEFTIPLSELDNTKWLNVDKRCRFHRDVSAPKGRRYVADIVRGQLSDVETVKQYLIGKLGAVEVEGHIMFCTGEGLIRPSASTSTKFEVKTDSLPYTLDVDPNISEAEAASGMMELISLSPNPNRVIVSQKLLYIKRKVYEDAWRSPRCIVYLWGLTGTQKTTMAAFLTQMYNRSKGIASLSRFNSTVAAAVKIIYQKSDCVEVIDDMYKSEASDTNHQQIETFFEIVRIIGDGIEPARVRGKQVANDPPTCGILFTGEYVLGSGSDASRFVPVEMTQPDSRRLKHFQDQPLIVSNFYHHYITWYVENYDNIKEWLKEWWGCYLESDLGVHDRLREAHFSLNSSYTMLLQYLYDKGFITEEDAKKLHLSFQDLLTSLVQAQEIRVKQDRHLDPAQVDPLAHIRTMYKGGSLHIAETAKHFREGVHDGVIHDNHLCLYGDSFRDKVCKSISITNHNDALDILKAQGVLKEGHDKRTIQIFATGGKRFYAIRLDALR